MWMQSGSVRTRGWIPNFCKLSGRHVPAVCILFFLKTPDLQKLGSFLGEIKNRIVSGVRLYCGRQPFFLRTVAEYGSLGKLKTVLCQVSVCTVDVNHFSCGRTDRFCQMAAFGWGGIVFCQMAAFGWGANQTSANFLYDMYQLSVYFLETSDFLRTRLPFFLRTIQSVPLCSVRREKQSCGSGEFEPRSDLEY